MNEIIQFCQPLFQPVVLAFTILNLLSMGLQVNLVNMFKVVRNPKFLGLVLVLGWVIGPAIAYLITLLLPLDNSYIIVLFIEVIDNPEIGTFCYRFIVKITYR